MASRSTFAEFILYQEEPLNAGTPLNILRRSFLTPQEHFFVRTHGTLPRIDQASYRLRIGGLVRRPIVLSCEELRAQFPEYTITASLQCAGSRRNELAAVRPIPGEVLWGADTVGTAVWRGVQLRDVLHAAGIQAEARYVAFTGLDTAQKEGKTVSFGSSIALGKALSPEVLLAYEMNGTPLTPEHGFPLRALIPGYIGARSVKWLQEIHVQDQPSANYFQVHDYKLFPSDVEAQNVDWREGKALEELPLNAVICLPRDGESLKAGTVGLQGYAITGGYAPVERVELSVDDGISWKEATIVSRAEKWAWCFWEASLHLPAGNHEIIARAWDAAGRTQPEHTRSLWNFRGYANNAWHRVSVHLS